jgi:hypothetical protein
VKGIQDSLAASAISLAFSEAALMSLNVKFFAAAPTLLYMITVTASLFRAYFGDQRFFGSGLTTGVFSALPHSDQLL